MEALEATVKIIDSLAWPGAAFGAAVLFRGELRGVIQRLRAVRGLGLEADIDKAEGLAQEAAGPGLKTLEAEAAAALPPRQGRDPRGIVGNSWRRLVDICERHQLPAKMRSIGSQLAPPPGTDGNTKRWRLSGNLVVESAYALAFEGHVKEALAESVLELYGTFTAVMRRGEDISDQAAHDFERTAFLVAVQLEDGFGRYEADSQSAD